MSNVQPTKQSGWTAWIYFAAVMMFLIGSLQIIAGLMAVLNDEWVVWTGDNAVLFDITAWGWLHMGLGMLLIVSGGFLLKGSLFGRIIAVVVALLSAIVNFAWLPVYPVWGIVMIAIDILVIFAVIAHGRELKD